MCIRTDIFDDNLVCLKASPHPLQLFRESAGASVKHIYEFITAQSEALL